jgi:hypothetical protein
VSSRREVLALIGGAAAAGVAAGGWRWAMAQSPGSGGSAPPPPSSPPVAPTTPAPPSEDAHALAAIAKRRYGAHLDDAQLEELTRAIERGIQGASAMSKVPLANADEPDTTFRA